MKPLKIEFELIGQMEVPQMPIHLDSLIAFARYQVALEREEGGDIRTVIQYIPLQRETRGEDWVWQASALAFSDATSAGQRHWTRRTIFIDEYARFLQMGFIDKSKHHNLTVAQSAARNKKSITNDDGTPKLFSQKIVSSSGPLKNELQMYPVMTVSKATAWCMGDPDELEMLLNPDMGYLTYFGKRSKNGHGRIKSVTITEDEAAHENWQLRILPWEKDGYHMLEANVRPPYWDVTERKIAWASPAIF